MNWKTALLAVASSLSCLMSVVTAGQPVVVGADVPDAKRVSVTTIKHDAWDLLLQKHVDAQGRVNYSKWKASRDDQRRLDEYLQQLSSATFSGSPSRDSQLAFWINAYNAVTVKGILREYPTSSIRNHTAKFVGYNIWKDLQLPVDGQRRSLDHIEHEILRKFGEPRIHFAIVCASIGCPRLLNRAYVAVEIDEQLSKNAKHFFADTGKFQSRPTQGSIAVSPIMKWFATDFGATSVEQLKTIAPYLPDEASRRLAESGKVQLSYLDYDWSLNDQR